MSAKKYLGVEGVSALTHTHTRARTHIHTHSRLYNLPEVMSAKKYLGVEGVSARFGTDPFFWNWVMWLMARLLPRSMLNDREFVRWFAALSDPFVRIVDAKVGEAVVLLSAFAPK